MRTWDLPITAFSKIKLALAFPKWRLVGVLKLSPFPCYTLNDRLLQSPPSISQGYLPLLLRSSIKEITPCKQRHPLELSCRDSDGFRCFEGLEESSLTVVSFKRISHGKLFWINNCMIQIKHFKNHVFLNFFMHSKLLSWSQYHVLLRGAARALAEDERHWDENALDPKLPITLEIV